MKRNENTLVGIAVLISIVVIMLATFSLGCTENPDNVPTQDTENGNVTEPVTINDSEQYMIGTAVVENVEILTLESFPVQINAVAKGYLPDGCTEIDENNIETKYDQNIFDISIKTIRPVDAVCTEAIVPFEETIALDVYGLKKGNYTVNINGVSAGFELPADNIIPE